MTNAQREKRYALKPSLECYHNRTKAYNRFDEFIPELPGLLQEAGQLSGLVRLTKVLGLVEPVTERYLDPEYIQVEGDNYRETLRVNGLISRNRAVLLLLEDVFGHTRNLQQLKIYVPEYYTGFAIWLSHTLGNLNLTFSEYMAGVTLRPGSGSSIMRQEDLSDLTFGSNLFDLVICNEIFEHLRFLPESLREIFRVLKPGGSLAATFPMAFGQYDHIQKTVYNSATSQEIHLNEPEYHGDPVRPDQGSLVYNIPGWRLLDELRDVGFQDPVIRHTVSWLHGIYGSDLPGVLVLHAIKPN